MIQKRQGMKFVAAFDAPVKLEPDGERVLVKEKRSGRLVAFLTKLGVIKMRDNE